MKVFHLKYEQLKKIARAPLSSALDKGTVEYHQQVKRYFNQLMDRTLHRPPNPDPVAGWRNVSDASSWLMNYGWYEHVANVTGTDVMGAWHQTQNIEGFWSLRNAKNIDVVKPTLRPTNTLDVFVEEKKFFLMITGGFIDMSTGLVVKAMEQM